MPHPGEPELAKVGPRDFSKKSLIIVHKAAFVLVKSCNSIEDVLQFYSCEKKPSSIPCSKGKDLKVLNLPSNLHRQSPGVTATSVP